MLSTPKSRGELFLAASLRDGLEDNDMRQVETLLSIKDADPNVLIPTHGISPFHLVIGNESEEFAWQVSKLFLRHGGDPNVRSLDGMTPVHVAAAWGRVGVLELLLANGGDPLCLDDEGRSPFHYAFDGSYYEAIAILAKYCGTSQENEEEEPKYKLTLDKIFINKGNVVAEYVPSRHSYGISVKPELTEETNSEICEEKLIAMALKESERSSLSETAADIDKNWSNINNVTVRRYKKSHSPEKYFDIPTDERRSIENEKILVGRIIRRLSNTLTSDKSSSVKDETAFVTIDEKNKISKRATATKREQPRSLIPPLSNRRNVKSKLTPIRKLAADTSIISKSPNCQISMINDKTPKAKISTPLTSKSRSNCRKKYFNNDKTPPLRPAKPPEARIKSASSTPKQTRYTGRLYGSAKISPKKLVKPRSVAKIVSEKKITSTTYGKIHENDKKIILYSPDMEVKRSRMIDRDYARKNIAVRLDDRMYDENPDIDEENWAKMNELTEETKRLVEGAPDDVKIEKNDDSVNDNATLLEQREIETRKIFESENSADGIENFWFESPGSSNPLSVCSLPRRKDLGESCDDEEEKILLEIEEACEKKCPTPPASVSMLENDENSTIEGETDRSERSNDESISIREYYKAYGEPETMGSWSRCESFVSVDEEYTYEDQENGVAFIERRLCVIPPSPRDDMNRAKEEASWIDRLGELSIGTSDYSTRLSPLTSAPGDDRLLRERLTALGDIPGPITKTTFNVYLKRLWRLERARKRNEKSLPIVTACKTIKSHDEASKGEIFGNPNDNSIPDYLLTTDWTTRRQYYDNLEDMAFKEYSIANPKRKYRGGVSKTSFCYILLDPRITRDLPRCGMSLTNEERWKIFLNGIFYIGKGKAARPAAHLYDAFGIWSKSRGIVDDASRKIRRILDIWRNDRGVVCLHVFSHTMTEEACSREASMIEALGIVHLTNCLQGTYYGYATTMSTREKRSLGKYLLYKSMEIFMHEGERQLFPRNVIM